MIPQKGKQYYNTNNARLRICSDVLKDDNNEEYVLAQVWDKYRQEWIESKFPQYANYKNGDWDYLQEIG